MRFKDTDGDDYYVTVEDGKVVIMNMYEGEPNGLMFALDATNASALMEALSYAHARVDPYLQALAEQA